MVPCHIGKEHKCDVFGHCGQVCKIWGFLEGEGEVCSCGVVFKQFDWSNYGLKEVLIILKERCVYYEGLCKCFEDSHCASSKKYFCRIRKVTRKQEYALRSQDML